ncbi:MAG: hypothetical protein JXX14_11225 [Deltaproteobacteria bacterium]|nr:hypothetical protein [Deltaproteobacteria bacterium]
MSKFVFILFSLWLASGCTEDLVVNDMGPKSAGEESDSDRPSADTDTGPMICAGSGTDSSVADAMLDFILVVDNSAGMEDEVRMLQAELPAFFLGLTQWGIDVHLTVISAPSPAEDDKIKNGICLDAPPGSGNCPNDSSLPTYLHIAQNIGSKDALTALLNTADRWNAAIRPGSQVHFMVVSDDNADVDAASFKAALAALTPPVSAFYFHGIGASMDKNVACDATPVHICCETAAKAAVVYQALSEQTGGVFHDLCDQDFIGAFKEVAAFISKSLCESGTEAQPE